MNFKTFAVGTLKLAIAMLLALIAFGICVVGYDAIRAARAKSEAKPLEEVKSWAANLKESLGIDFNARTKLVGGLMYVDISAIGFPRYLSDPTTGAKNRSESFTIIFYDADGFKVTEKQIQVASFTQMIGANQQPSGMSYQYEEALSAERYKSIANMRVGWTVETKVAEPASGTAEVHENQDHCAAGLSKSQRLQRLRGYGNLRETGYGEFSAGSHSVMFSGSELISCY